MGIGEKKATEARGSVGLSQFKFYWHQVNYNNKTKHQLGRMLSKMMAPGAAKQHAKSLTTNEENTTISLNESGIDSEKTEEQKKKQKAKSSTKSANSNWAKYKDVVNKPSSQKSPSKRQSSKSESQQKGKRKSHAKAAESINPISKDVKINMDFKNMSLTKQVAMDCEMVGIGDGTKSMLARVSIVNRHGACIYDNYVKPQETVRNYRTAVSGIRPHHLQNGRDFQLVQSEVSAILRGRTLVGHALKNDLAVLFLSHPKRHLRDTSRYNVFRKVSKGNTPSLKTLAAELLGVDIQTGEHNSVEDARAAMQLYVLYRNRWESDIRNR